jgi:hypothetical protein
MIDHDKAARLAAETLVKYGANTSPISPLPMLEQMGNVVAVSFSDISASSGIRWNALLPIFGKNRDAVTSLHTENGRSFYVVAYNSLLPFSMIQRALARELGHIVLRHDGTSPDNTEEAEIFARHLLCPRPLIHAIQVTGIRITVDFLAHMTGVFGQFLSDLRQTPKTSVPAGLNRFVRSQFMPFVLNIFDYFRAVMPSDCSALADFGTFMDGYEE